MTMAIETIDDILTMLKSYLNDEWPPEPAPEKLKGKIIHWKKINKQTRSTTMAQILLEIVNGITSDLRRTLLSSITQCFAGADKQKNTQTKIAYLKQSLGNSKNNWKHALLGVNQKVVSSAFFTQKTFNNDAKVAVTHNKDRFTHIEPKAGPKNDQAAALGSSFTTNKEQYISNHQSPVLDALYSAITLDNQQRENGIIFAVADGTGGHFGDERFDMLTARAAHFATKHAVRLMGSYLSADELLQDLKNIVTSIATEIRRKAPNAGTTLLAVRAYPINPQEYRIAGFNIGDGLLMGWHADNKNADTLAPAHLTVSGTAELPDGYREFDIHLIDKVIPIGTLLFPMSDGMVDGLPHQRVKKTYPNALEYYEISLNNESITNFLQPLKAKTPAEEYLSTLLNYVTHAIDIQRQELIGQNETIQLGDDISILAVRLQPQKKSFSKRVGNKFTKLFQPSTSTQQTETNPDTSSSSSNETPPSSPRSTGTN